MPKLTGFEVCRKLREHEETKATPILLVTTRGEAENIQQGYDAGCSDYITKPINGGEFVSKLRSYLAGGAARAR
jgi:DNA-binding response OmpR family regulator